MSENDVRDRFVSNGEDFKFVGPDALALARAAMLILERHDDDVEAAGEDLERLAEACCDEGDSVEMSLGSDWLDADEYPAWAVDRWSEPTGFELAGPEGQRYQQRTVSRGSRKGESGWYDTQGKRFMPAGWQPSKDKKKAAGKPEARPEAKAKGGKSRPDVDEVQNAVEKAIASDKPATREDAEALGSTLASMTDAQIRELRGRLGMHKTGPKSNRKADRVKEIVDGILAAQEGKEGPRPGSRIDREPADEDESLDFGDEPATEVTSAEKRRFARLKGAEADSHFASTIESAIHSSPSLSEEQRQLYGKAMSDVYDRLPRHAKDRIASNLGDVKFAQSRRAMADRVAEDFEADGLHDLAKQYRGKHGDYLGGCRRTDTSTLYLDGGYDEATGPARVDQERFESARGDAAQRARAIYAHELAHAIDDGRQFSDGDDWAEVFRSELKGYDKATGLYNLTSYANTNPEECFAEFARVVYSGRTPLADVKATFPKASKFFEDNGLWPEDDGAGGTGRRVAAKDVFDSHARIDMGDRGHGDVVISGQDRSRSFADDRSVGRAPSSLDVKPPSAQRPKQTVQEKAKAIGALKATVNDPKTSEERLRSSLAALDLANMDKGSLTALAKAVGAAATRGSDRNKLIDAIERVVLEPWQMNVRGGG